MPKATMISFRTTEVLGASLQRIARERKTTLSGFIDGILQEYLASQACQDILLRDRRQCQRQQESIPAIIRGRNGAGEFVAASRINDLSLGGIGLAGSRRTAGVGAAGGMPVHFDVIFPLPRAERPVSIQCQAMHVHHAGDMIQIGASFDDADPDSYQALRGYLT